MTPLTAARSLDADELSLIAESIPHIVWMASADGATTYFNRQGTDDTGCPPEANYDWNWVDLVHPDDAERARLGWEHATTAEIPYALEYRIRRHDGEFRWHAFQALPIRGQDGKISTWIGTATDIEEHKQLEALAARVRTQGAGVAHAPGEHQRGHTGRVQAHRSRLSSCEHQRQPRPHHRPLNRGAHRANGG
ncbi:MAG TPA: PAS domain-containing protein [Nocardioides sp.]|nr:PAS domain-containing protein [Nocardioides sp.]